MQRHNQLRFLAAGITAAISIGFGTAAQADNSVTVQYGVGEYKNAQDVEQSAFEIQQHLYSSPVYLKARATSTDHPFDDADGEEFLGGVGFLLDSGIGMEVLSSDEAYRFYGYYRNDNIYPDNITGLPLVFEGGMTHSDKYEGKFSRTNLVGHVGLNLDMVEIGGFYQTGDTDKQYVSDLYGGYAKIKW